jgi:hypothetical protein
MREFFEHRVRESGEVFWSLTDDRPEWLVEAVRDAHDGELPNDWRYEHCWHIACMVDRGESDPFVIADALVDVATSDLLSWAAEYPGRLGYCDEASEGQGIAGGVEFLLRAGQLLCLERMASVLVDVSEWAGGEGL